MAILRPEAIDDAPARGPQRSGGRRGGGFLVSRGMRDPGSQATYRLGWSRRGRKLPDAVAAKAIEAQPSSGQIKPSRGTWAAPLRDRPRGLRGVARTASTALDSLGRATIHLNAWPAKAEKSGPQGSPRAALRRAHQSVGTRRCRAGRPRTNQRRLSAARRRRITGRRGAVDLIPAGLATAPGGPRPPRSTRSGAIARGFVVRDRARQGRNGAAGSSEADEPGPKGDVQSPAPS